MSIIRECILKGEDYKTVCFTTLEIKRLEELEERKRLTSTHFKIKGK
jgi:hypothetical protein